MGLRRAILAATAAALILPASASAVANHFGVATPPAVTAGTQFSTTVTARNPDNSIDTAYNGPVSLSSSDPAAALPANVTLTSGTGSFNATLNTPGCRRITGSDGAISGSSPQIAVNGCDVIDAQTGDLSSPPDPTQTGMLDRAGGPSQCSSTKSQTLNPATGARSYDAFTYTNITNGPLCITVDLDPGASCAAFDIFNASYVGAFNPANPLANYAGDPGVSSPAGGTVVSESFTVPVGGSFTNVVHAVGTSGSCTGYFYSASSSKPFALSLPSATGTPAVGSVLGWDTGVWAGTPSFSYQWLRCDAAGASCADIAGATAGTYAPTQEDVGSTLRIRVADTDALGTSTADSPATAVVTGSPPPAGAAPTSVVTGRIPKKKKKCKKKKRKAAAAAAKKKCKKKR